MRPRLGVVGADETEDDLVGLCERGGESGVDVRDVAAGAGGSVERRDRERAADLLQRDLDR